MKRFSQRYVLATLAFLLAAIHASLSVTRALECLIAFTLVYALTGAVQRGRARVEGRRGNASHHSPSRRASVRPPRFEPVLERHLISPDGDRYRSRRSSQQSAGSVYDFDGRSAEDDWATAADGSW